MPFDNFLRSLQHQNPVRAQFNFSAIRFLGKQIGKASRDIYALRIRSMVQQKHPLLIP